MRAVWPSWIAHGIYWGILCAVFTTELKCSRNILGYIVCSIYNRAEVLTEYTETYCVRYIQPSWSAHGIYWNILCAVPTTELKCSWNILKHIVCGSYNRAEVLMEYTETYCVRYLQPSWSAHGIYWNILCAVPTTELKCSWNRLRHIVKYLQPNWNAHGI
jgi:ferredoxin-thioredoxin reductase catalytic subunit